MNGRSYSIEDWKQVQKRYDWTGLLVGNGASLAVWPNFAYKTLFEKATFDPIDHPLSPEDQEFFAAFDKTTNFELVLSALSTTETVCKILGQVGSYGIVCERRKNIQRALVDAVHAVHIPYSALGSDTLSQIRSALLAYKHVFSTNYDLLLYWAIMSEPWFKLKDYFFSEDSDLFDRGNAVPFDGSRTILYLHGGLHLVRQPSGRTRKLSAESGRLLDQFGTGLQPDEIPLIVTEGTTSNKLASIYQSDYLLFAYEQFLDFAGPVVVFGHALEKSDEHLVEALRKRPDRPVAISIHPGSDEKMTQRVAAYVEKLPNIRDLFFFFSTTHPLGLPSLEIQPNGETNI